MRACLAILAAATLQLPARADAETSRRVIVIANVVKDSDALGEADAESLYEGAVGALAFAVDVELAPKDECVEHAASAGAACGTELACLSRHLVHAELTELVELVEDLTVDPPLLSGQLVDTRRGAVVARDVVEVDRSARTARSAAESLVARLVSRAGWTLGGIARLAITPAEATIQVVPAPARRSEDLRSFVGAAGEYSLRIEAPGFDDADRTITLRPGEEERVDVELTPRSVLRSGWLWAGVAVAVVGAGVALAWTMRSDQLELCQGTPEACGR